MMLISVLFSVLSREFLLASCFRYILVVEFNFLFLLLRTFSFLAVHCFFEFAKYIICFLQNSFCYSLWSCCSLSSVATTAEVTVCLGCLISRRHMAGSVYKYIYIYICIYSIYVYLSSSCLSNYLFIHPSV